MIVVVVIDDDDDDDVGGGGSVSVSVFVETGHALSLQNFLQFKYPVHPYSPICLF